MTIALLTIATRGVGLEPIRRLSAAGHALYLGARDLDRGREAAEKIGARAIAIDVTDDASVRGVIDSQHAVGALDVLVNNAGISGAQRRPAEADVTDLEAVLARNVVDATRVLVACIPMLEECANPVAVNRSSVVGSLTLNARPEATWSLVAYPVSKARRPEASPADLLGGDESFHVDHRLRHGVLGPHAILDDDTFPNGSHRPELARLTLFGQVTEWNHRELARPVPSRASPVSRASAREASRRRPTRSGGLSGNWFTATPGVLEQ